MNSRPDLIALALRLRSSLENVFGSETAVPGTQWTSSVPSAGHCAAVAAILHHIVHAELWSGMIEGTSHWFNAVELDGTHIFLDITGYQFGRPIVKIWEGGEAYGATRRRDYKDLNTETLERAAMLAERAGLPEVAAALRGGSRKPHMRERERSR